MAKNISPPSTLRSCIVPFPGPRKYRGLSRPLSETVAILVGIDLHRLVNRLLPQLVLQHVARNVGIVLQAQFVEDPCPVGADRFWTQMETFGDFD